MSAPSPGPGTGWAEEPTEPAAGVGRADDRLADDQMRGDRPPDEQGTGHPAVDRVLRDLDGLEQRPVAEHAAAYQQAHERLTRALDPVETRLSETRVPGSGGAGQ